MAKKENAPGAKKKPAKEKRVRPFWNKLVETLFDFCKDKFGEPPTFDGSSPRDYGMIVDAIEKKALEKHIIWTESIAVRSINLFLDYCFKDEWLSKNFVLATINRQKDKIFFKIKMDRDGKSDSKIPRAKQFGSIKTAGQEIFAERLGRKLDNLHGG